MKVNVCALFTVLVMTISLCCCRHGGESVATDRYVEIDRLVADSLYSGPEVVKRHLGRIMRESDDSLVYYYAMASYMLPCAYLEETDSMDYCFSRVTGFGRRNMDRLGHDTVFNAIMMNAYNVKGTAYTLMRKSDSAVVYMKKALQYSAGSKRPRMLIAMGEAYYREGDYPLSAYYYREAMMSNDSLGRPEDPAVIYNGLAQTYLQSHDYVQAEKYLSYGLEAYDKMDVFDRYFLLNSFGNLYYNKKEYAMALPYFTRADSLMTPYKAQAPDAYVARMNMGEIYINLNMYDSAAVCLADVAPSFSMPGYEVFLYHLNTMRFALAVRSGKMSQAAGMLGSLLQTLDEGSEDLKIIRKRYLRDFYEKAGMYRQAYDMELEIRAVEDSLRNVQVQANVASITLQYQQDTLLLSQKNHIMQQNSEMRDLRFMTMLWVAIAVAVALAGVVSLMVMKKQRDKMISKHIENVSRLKMENIRNCISPHFTFNVLNRHISGYAEDDPHRQDMMNLVKLLRRCVEVSSQMTVTLAEELEFVSTYVNLECGRWGSDFHYRLSVAGDIDADSFRIPSMMIQIPVENAIKHGLRGIEEGERVLDIDITCEDGNVKIAIVNNGTGYRPRLMSSGTGKGMQVIYQTIQLHNMKNKEHISFTIGKDKPDNGGMEGTRVVYTIPCKFSYGEWT